MDQSKIKKLMLLLSASLLLFSCNTVNNTEPSLGDPNGGWNFYRKHTWLKEITLIDLHYRNVENAKLLKGFGVMPGESLSDILRSKRYKKIGVAHPSPIDSTPGLEEKIMNYKASGKTDLLSLIDLIGRTYDVKYFFMRDNPEDDLFVLFVHYLNYDLDLIADIQNIALFPCNERFKKDLKESTQPIKEFLASKGFRIPEYDRVGAKSTYSIDEDDCTLIIKTFPCLTPRIQSKLSNLGYLRQAVHLNEKSNK